MGGSQRSAYKKDVCIVYMYMQHRGQQPRVQFRQCFMYGSATYHYTISECSVALRVDFGLSTIESRIRCHSSWYNAVWLGEGGHRSYIDSSMYSLESISRLFPTMLHAEAQTVLGRSDRSVLHGFSAAEIMKRGNLPWYKI